MNRTAAVLVIAATCAYAPLAAMAQRAEPLSYRCVGKDGKKYYGQTMPAQCVGMPVEMLNRQGVVVKRVDPKADAEDKERRKAEEAKKREEEAALKEQRRRDKALLATYTSEADIEYARKRALADHDKAVQQIGTRIETAKRRQSALAKEMEFYKGKNKPPAKLVDDIKAAEADLKAQEAAREAKKKDVDAINAKYDEDKRRYIELTRGTAPAKK